MTIYRVVKGKKARAVPISLFQEHIDILLELEKRMNCNKSKVIQKLLKRESKDFEKTEVTNFET